MVLASPANTERRTINHLYDGDSKINDFFFFLSIQLQREEPAETPRVHRPPGEAAELGSQLLRGSIRHPHPRPAENRKVLSSSS